MFGCPHLFGCIPCMFGCPHVHTPACMFGCPPMFGYSPVHLGTPMFGCLLNMCGTPICLDPPICLDALICLEDVWMAAVHIQHKESMLCQTEGDVHMPLYIWMPMYVWTSPICLDVPHTFGCHQYIWQHPNIQWRQPNIWRASKYTGGVQTCGASSHTEGCPNIGGNQAYS